jgi:hypothetical protein
MGQRYSLRPICGIPLEPLTRARFLIRVLSTRITVGLWAGLVSAAATAGVLVGLGLRHDAATTAFFLAGRSLVASSAGMIAPTPVAVVLGIVIHVAWMVLWGVCFTIVAARLRGAALFLAAALFAALIGTLSATFLPGALGAGAVAALTRAQTLFFLSLLGLSLAAGTLIARTTR